MQNLTTTFLKDIKERRGIIVPAGKANFLWIDVDDIGKAMAYILQNRNEHKNKAYTITGTDVLSFGDVAQTLSETLNEKSTISARTLYTFFLNIRKEEMAAGFIVVMIARHFLPRFQKAPQVLNHFTMLTGEQ